MAELHEFDLIRDYFTAASHGEGRLLLGVGDDCALFQPDPDCQLAVTTDTLVAGVHFPADCDPHLLAGRCLRVNLSDLAAMGATPLGFQLALTLPAVDTDWLAGFSSGLFEAATRFDCPLSGGDTTKGPLTITITALGQVPRGRALLRSGARPGDRVYVTGPLGDARGALELIKGGVVDADNACREQLLAAYWCPQPMLAAAVALRDFASAALDISDGLLQDLGHIVRRSHVAAVVHREQVPVTPALVGLAGRERALDWALAGGDDYQLCFTVPVVREQAMTAALADLGVSATAIGEIIAGAGDVQCIDSDGNPCPLVEKGYAHF